MLLLVGVLLVSAPLARAQTNNTVFLVQIRDTIDLGLAPYLARVLDEAEAHGAQAVILEINTPGGRLDAALQMRDAILDTPVRTIAFVNREAFSAGALIAIAAKEIYLAPGAVIGAATPVDGAGDAGDEKIISAVRTTFKATAELRGRDPRIAEAMVDPAVAIPGVVEQNRLLTLTTEEARSLGYADGVAASRQELLAAAELASATLQETAPGPAEWVVRVLTNPAVASLLVALGVLLILADVYTSGFGAVGLVGIGLLALFFWGHALAGLAGWEGIALVLAGLLLVGVEVFVIPGFGVAGVLGIAALLGGLFLSLIGGEIVTGEDLARAGYTVGGAFLLMIAGSVMLIRLLPRAAGVQGLILQAQLGRAEVAPRRSGRLWRWLEGSHLEAHTAGVKVEQRPSLHGATGVALSPLRPGGIARIGSERIDVVTQGEYIPAGAAIVVIADQGYRRVVRRAEDPAPADASGDK
jgi:membrane-bound serine protease (ClpP class)